MNEEIEIWKDVVGLEGFYQVSSLGRMKSLQRFRVGRYGNNARVPEKILKVAISKAGYPVVNIGINAVQNVIYVHRMVAETFLENPNGKKTVNHKDGVKTNNNVLNLEWATHSENCKHAIDTGLRVPVRGEKGGKTRLTSDDVLNIRDMSRNGVSSKLIAEKYSMSQRGVNGIISKTNWSHV